jgi:hypothetical protein
MKNYQILLQNITSQLKTSEQQFLFEVMKEELKKIRQEDIILKDETRPRPLTFINRDAFDLSSSKLRALDVIKDPIALESPLQSLNFLINNISLEQDTVLALRLVTKCFDSRTGEADLIVHKIHKIIFHTTDYIQYNASIIVLLIEINYGGQTSKGLKYFEHYDRFIAEIRRIYRKYNYQNPIANVNKINKKLLGIINDELRRNSKKENLVNTTLLEELKAELIQNTD